MVDVLSDIEILAYPHPCQGDVDDAHYNFLTGLSPSKPTSNLDWQDNAMMDMLPNITVPSPLSVSDTNTYYLDGQDDALVDILTGIEIPSSPPECKYRPSGLGLQADVIANVDRSGLGGTWDLDVEMPSDVGPSSVGIADKGPVWVRRMLNKDTQMRQMQSLERHFNDGK